MGVPHLHGLQEALGQLSISGFSLLPSAAFGLSEPTRDSLEALVSSSSCEPLLLSL